MTVEIPQYQPAPQPETDPVKRSIAKPDAFAKPGTLSKGKGVRVRVTQGDKSLKRKRKKKTFDKRDVHFF